MAQPAQPSLGELTGIGTAAHTIARIESAEERADAEHSRRKANELVRRAAKAWLRNDFPRTGQLALRATEADESHALAFHLLALALERMGHLHKSLVTFERAYALDPGEPELLLNLGLVAWKLGLFEQAAELFRRFIARRPESPLGHNNLGSVLYDLGRSEESLETLRQALFCMPGEAVLWNSIATVLAEVGRAEEGLIFYREAIALDPAYSRPWHNLGYALMHLGRMDEALAAYDEALARANDPSDAREGTHSRSVCLLGMGRLKEGFQAYEIRNDPKMRGYTHHMIEAPAWTGEALGGKRLLVIAEQGLGDEIMFANVLPDLLEAVGKDGHLQIAVAPRLVALFQRSFPRAEVGFYDDRIFSDANGSKELRFVPFANGENRPHFYTTMGTPLQHFRKHITDFPGAAYLTCDPVRAGEMRDRLVQLGAGPYVGICWRSMLKEVKRQKYFSALELWGPILKTPGITFVNVQYGDCRQELAAAEALHGVEIHSIEGLDLRSDLDGAAALSAALDLVISAPTAAAALAGSVGTETWFLTAGRTWPQLGTERYPWYRAAPVFSPAKFGDWASLMPQVAQALAQFAAKAKAA